MGLFNDKTVILYRKSNSIVDDEQEITAINAVSSPGFQLLFSRRSIPEKALVIARYSALPFYRELEQDVLLAGSQLINTYSQHNYIADMQNWVADLKELTPKTWTEIVDVPDNEGPFVLKGATNSKKWFWKEMMFAENKRQAIDIQGKLLKDGLIGDQSIYIRKYIPLFSYGENLGGCPVSKEFRFFVYRSQIIAGGFYWSNYVDEIANPPTVEEVPSDFLKEIIARVGYKANAFAVDVAQGIDGKWWVIELNDLQQSGLSSISPNIFYQNLYNIVDNYNKILRGEVGE